MSRVLVANRLVTPWRGFRLLSAISLRDMLRNPLTGLSMLVLFSMVLTVYAGLWIAFTVLGPAPDTSVEGSDGAYRDVVVEQLQSAGIAVTPVGDESAQAHVFLAKDRANVVIEDSSQTAWNGIWTALRSAGISPRDITIADENGEERIDPLRVNLGLVAMLGVAAVAFVGTTVPLVGMRQRGILRLIGTTPLGRAAFLTAQLPPRVLLIACEIAVVIGIAEWRGYVDGVAFVSVTVTFLLGALMLIGVGLIFAGRSRDAEASQQTMTMITVLLVLPAGGLAPAEIVPPALQLAMNCVPTTWLSAAAAADLTGAEPFLPVPVLWALMAIAAAIAVAVAVHRFQWDQEEGRGGPEGRRRYGPHG